MNKELLEIIKALVELSDSLIDYLTSNEPQDIYEAKETSRTIKERISKLESEE